MAFKIPAADRPRTAQESLDLIPGIRKQVQAAVSDIKMSSDEAGGIARSLKEAFRNTDGWTTEQRKQASLFGDEVATWIFRGKQGLAFESEADRENLNMLVTDLYLLGDEARAVPLEEGTRGTDADGLPA